MTAVLERPTPPTKRRPPHRTGPRHRISQRDNVALTGVCSLCGPVKLKVRSATVILCENVVRNARHEQLVELYGITGAEYDAMVAEREGRCDICHEVPEKTLNVDHDHETGAVRGLLYGNCNRGIGLLGESVERLRAALEYLS